MEYPYTKKVDVVDDYHGTKVADPYRWLEEPESPDKAIEESTDILMFIYENIGIKPNLPQV